MDDELDNDNLLEKLGGEEEPLMMPPQAEEMPEPLKRGQIPPATGKDDPRDRLKSYLQAQMAREQRRNSPEAIDSRLQNQGNMANAMDNASLGSLFMNSAAKVGSIGGKTADTSAADNFSNQLNKNQQDYMARSNDFQNRREGREDKQAKLLEYLAAQKSKEDAMLGSRSNAQAAMQFKQDQLAKQDEYRNKLLAMKRQELAARGEQKKAEKAPSDVAKKAKGFAISAQMANDQFNKMLEENKEYDPASLSESAIDSAGNIPIVGNAIRAKYNSPQYKMQKQLEKQYVTAVLRPESGAAISETELERDASKYFPRAGDTPEILAQKNAARKQKIDNLVAEAGSFEGAAPVQVAATPMAKPSNESGTAMASPAMVKIKAPDGSIRSVPASSKEKYIQKGGVEVE